jgi:hypothetical protein
MRKAAALAVLVGTLASVACTTQEMAREAEARAKRSPR